ncbi:MAG: tRNA pseudouridine(55) synthase TruB [Myxococcota bacterium]
MRDAFLVVDKPPGVTSHDVVAVVRAVTGLKKVGHTGTLDPFATGVLPLALGGATRLIQYLDEDRKVYDAVVRLGVATDTGDPTGTAIAEKPVPPLARRDVEAVLATFLGQRMQTPPRYSAVKVAGRPLYEYARKGQEVEVKARPIRIDGMELVSLDAPRLRVVITCSRGTYARVLAEQIGEALGTVGHLEELRRIASGPFHVDQAVPLSRLSEIVAGDPAWDRVLRPARGEERVPWRPREQVFAGLEPFLIGPRDALRHLPAITLTPFDARRFRQTGSVPPAPPQVSGPYLLLEGDEILGVGTPGSPAAVPLASETPRGRGPGPERRERRH